MTFRENDLASSWGGLRAEDGGGLDQVVVLAVGTHFFDGARHHPKASMVFKLIQYALYEPVCEVGHVRARK
jgi:hypothetical protein